MPFPRSVRPMKYWLKERIKKSVQISFIKRIFISLGIFTLLSLTVLFLFVPNKGSESYQQEIPRSGTLENDTIVKAIWIQFACDCPRWVAYEAYLDESYLKLLIRNVYILATSNLLHTQLLFAQAFQKLFCYAQMRVLLLFSHFIKHMHQHT